MLLSSSAKSWAELSEDFRSAAFCCRLFLFREIPWHIDSSGKLDSRTQLEAARKAGRCLTLTSREQVVIVPAYFAGAS